MQAIILAGGLGTRLKSITGDIPKALINISGKPFIDYQIEYIRNQGIEEIFFALGYESNKLKKYISNKYSNILYSVENKPLGTGGAVKLAIRNHYKKLDKSFFVLNGDSLIDINYQHLYDFHKNKQSNVTIGLIEVDDVDRYGKIGTKNGDIIKFNEKSDNGPGLINSGVYLFRKDIERLFPKEEKFSLENDFFPNLIGNNFKGVILKHSFFIDIGTTESFNQLKMRINTKGDWIDRN